MWLHKNLWWSKTAAFFLPTVFHRVVSQLQSYTYICLQTPTQKNMQLFKRGFEPPRCGVFIPALGNKCGCLPSRASGRRVTGERQIRLSCLDLGLLPSSWQWGHSFIHGHVNLYLLFDQGLYIRTVFQQHVFTKMATKAWIMSCYVTFGNPVLFIL